jgi:hypothetical protein
VKKAEMENAATASPRGTDSSTVSYPIESTAPNVTIPIPLRCGVVGNVIAGDTQAHSSPLSDAEAKMLARIRKDRRNGFMVSAVDVDFLLELIGRWEA